MFSVFVMHQHPSEVKWKKKHSKRRVTNCRSHKHIESFKLVVVFFYFHTKLKTKTKTKNKKNFKRSQRSCRVQSSINIVSLTSGIKNKKKQQQQQQQNRAYVTTYNHWHTSLERTKYAHKKYVKMYWSIEGKLKGE